MFINTNVSAMNAQRHVFNSNKSMDKTLERLASGLRINSGADDASGLAIAEKMNAQNAGLQVAVQNAQDGQALYKIAEGALTQVSTMLTRMEELGVRATNGTLTDSDRTAITSEVNELRDQINQISSSTEYNTLKILNGSMAIETHISDNVANPGIEGSVRIVEKPGTMKTGTYTVQITHHAQAAYINGNGMAPYMLSSGLTNSGIININGIDISMEVGDTVSAAVAKINAVNDQTGVVSVQQDLFGFTADMVLISGTLDDDAANIDPTDTNVVGYANTGSKEEITVSGNAAVLNELAILTLSGKGHDAEGTINGVAAKSDGSRLIGDQAGSGSYGMVLDTQLHNGGNGLYIQDNTTYIVNGYWDSTDHNSRTWINDQFTIEADVTDRLRLQVGANTNQSIYNGIENVSTGQLGIGGSSKFGSLDDIELDTTDNANISLKVIQKAIEDVSKLRSKIGATMNRLDYTVKTLSIQRENLTNAQSRIQDADISAEMTNFTKQQILLQTGTAMLSQANARPQSVLSLLR